MKSHKKLIEVALPLEAINEEGSRRKRKAPSGYPTTLHKWWAQRPVAAARGILFAQMVDDPSSLPDLFPTEKKQHKERERLFRIIEELVLWDNTKNESVLERARAEIWQSWRRACAENADHPRAKDLFDRNRLPAFYDPFAGSGALPMEAQRLGLWANASDLNPVAVLLNKAMIEIPPLFAGGPPINPDSRNKMAHSGSWKGAQGLADDVRYYAQWMREEAERRIGDLYPSIEVTAEMATGRPDLKPYVGQRLPAIAWIWARTVKSPNPAYSKVDVPLASTFMLSNKAGKEAYVEPVIESGSYRFAVTVGKPKSAEQSRNGTKLARGANFRCLMSGAPIDSDYIYSEASAGRMGCRLMAIVAEGKRGRIFLSPTHEQELAASSARPDWKPDVEMPHNPRWFSPPLYGLKTYGDLFTSRQLVALTTFAELIGSVRQKALAHAIDAGRADDGRPLSERGTGALAYAEAVAVFLTIVLSRVLHYGSAICTWLPKDAAIARTFTKQALQMTWDFAEGSPFGKSSTEWTKCAEVIVAAIEMLPAAAGGAASQADATASSKVVRGGVVVSTDPPYFDNIGYADLSDFFYVWLRPCLREIYPELFATVAVPKAEELVAAPYRHGGKANAEAFFLRGMTEAMHELAEVTHPAFPLTIYYAFKQSETESDLGTASTGWETFLDAVIRAGFSVSGTWPVRTEGDNRQVSLDTNALASSIVMVCRKRPPDAPTVTRREFVSSLKADLPTALRRLQEGNIAPVDLAQAAIGPGMAIYTRFARVLDANGDVVPVRDALALINQVLDETLAEQEGDLDADSRWALAWFEQHGFAEGEFGVANVLAQAKNTGMNGLVAAGILESKRGKVRLLKSSELPTDWDPLADTRLTDWEVVHHLIRVLEAGGEIAAADLVVKLGSKAEVARELAYRLYTVCERKKRASEALAYNALVQSFPEITRLASGGSKIEKNGRAGQGGLFDEG